MTSKEKKITTAMNNALNCTEQGRDDADTIQTFLRDSGEIEASCDAAYAVEFFELAKRALLRARIWSS